jgi:hypothetical protein
MWGTWGSAIDVAVSNIVSDEHGMASVAKVRKHYFDIIQMHS